MLSNLYENSLLYLDCFSREGLDRLNFEKSLLFLSETLPASDLESPSFLIVFGEAGFETDTVSKEGSGKKKFRNAR